jgi:hypothetical protein
MIGLWMKEVFGMHRLWPKKYFEEVGSQTVFL